MKHVFIVAPLLTALFVILKLAGALAWSWWWIVSPLSVYVLFAIVIVVELIRYKRWVRGLREDIKEVEE